MNLPRILLTMLVTGIIAQAAEPSPASTPGALNPTANAGEARTMLVGRWRFTYPPRGWGGSRDFKADGTMTGEGFGGVAKWTLVNNIVHIEYPKGDLEEMQLPLNPAGMKVRTRNGKIIVTAVKLTDDGKPPAPPAQAKPEEPRTGSTPAPFGLVTQSDETRATLVGRWNFTYPPKGWVGFRDFKADGTVTGLGFGGVGKWTLSGNIIHIEYPSKDKEEMQLPLNPSGMKIRAQNGKITVTAVKVAGDSQAPATPSQPQP